jgi:hypothetical protein
LLRSRSNELGDQAHVLSEENFHALGFDGAVAEHLALSLSLYPYAASFSALEWALHFVGDLPELPAWCAALSRGPTRWVAADGENGLKAHQRLLVLDIPEDNNARLATQAPTLPPDVAAGVTECYWYHGTLLNHVPSILQGISIDAGKPRQDFSSARGFYLNNRFDGECGALSRALNLCINRSSDCVPAVICYRIPNALLVSSGPQIDLRWEGVRLKPEEVQERQGRRERIVRACRSAKLWRDLPTDVQRATLS